MTGPHPDSKRKLAAPATSQVLPLELRIGDRLVDELGEWDVVGRPLTTAAGKNAHARVRKVSQPEMTDLRTWGAHKRITVKRATSGERTP